jgi:hypothetical protein
MSKATRSPGSPAAPSHTSRLSLSPKDGLRATIVLALCLAAAAAIAAMSASAFAASPDMEAKALVLQSRVAETKLGRKVIDALGDAYAGVWFEPAAAQFHVGVTSAASSRVVTRLAEQAGLAADVVATPVRSTWADLIAAQGEWNRRLARLLVSDDATTGLKPGRNAVSVILSSSISAPERAMLKDDAADAGVNVVVRVEPSPKLGWVHAAKKTCEAAFTSGSAFCEEAITAGVGIGIESVQPECTAGPELIEGNETWMLTAGHCLGGATEGVGFLNTEVTSAYPAGALKLLGKEGTRYNNIKRDMGEVRVLSGAEGGFFAEALPTPVPALVTEWVKSPKTPHAVEGIEEAIEKQKVCKQGMKSGERCGEVREVNVTTSAEHTFVASACGEKGDSGGPVYIEGKYEMMGITISIKNKCGEAGAQTAFEPLKGFPQFEELGILGTFAGQSLLTTANEKRPTNKLDVSLLPGEKYPLSVQLSDDGKTPTQLEATNGNTLAGKGVSLSLKLSELGSSGTFESILLNVAKSSTKCSTSGAAEGEVKTKGEWHLVPITTAPLVPGIAFLFEEVKITCGKVKVNVKGCALAASDAAEGKDVTSTKVTLGGSKGKATNREYVNAKSEKVKCILESNFGTGFLESDQVVNEGKEVALEALEKKMIKFVGI